MDPLKTHPKGRGLASSRPVTSSLECNICQAHGVPAAQQSDEPECQQLASIDLGCRLAAYWELRSDPVSAVATPANADPLGRTANRECPRGFPSTVGRAPSEEASSEYEKRAEAELGVECARWLATGQEIGA